MIKAVIIDDEKSAREILSGMLKNYCPEVEITGMANSVKKGIELIQKLQPDLVFLDIKMPLGSGFDLLESIAKINFEVIFTTAYDQYALKAIKFSALDYLLKPIDVLELKAAVKKVSESKSQHLLNKKLETFIENITAKNKQLTKIVIPLSDGFKVIEVKDIIRCQSDRNYTNIFIADGSKILSSRTLKDFEELLSEYNFFRIHQSHLINLNKVKFYGKGRGGQVELSDGSTVDIARSKRAEFIKRFN